MPSRFLFSLIGALCVVVASAAHSQEKTSPTVKTTEITIKGVTHDTSHNCLPNVTVTLASAGRSVTTDGNGKFTLTFAAKSPRPDSKGNVDTVIFSKDGYVTTKVTIKNYTNPVNASLAYVTNNKGLAHFTEQVPMSHALGWIHSKAKAFTGEGLTDAKYNQIVKEHGAAEKQETTFRIYLPSGVKKVQAANVTVVPT